MGKPVIELGPGRLKGLVFVIIFVGLSWASGKDVLDLAHRHTGHLAWLDLLNPHVHTGIEIFLTMFFLMLACFSALIAVQPTIVRFTASSVDLVLPWRTYRHLWSEITEIHRNGRSAVVLWWRPDGAPERQFRSFPALYVAGGVKRMLPLFALYRPDLLPDVTPVDAAGFTFRSSAPSLP